MKLLFLYAFAGAIELLALTSCQKEDMGPQPVAIEASSLTAESQEGAVKISWKIPEAANYEYIRVTYTHPGTGKKHIRLASVYADHIVIDGLLKRYGPIEFKLMPVTAKGREGEVRTITAESLALPKKTKVISDSKEQMKIDPTRIWASNPQQDNEGLVASLVDDNYNTILHFSWSNPKPFPHYIVMEMPVKTNTLSFFLKNRTNANNNNRPKRMNLWVSETFDGATYNPADFNAHKVAKFEGMPEGSGSEVESPGYILPSAMQYVWFEVLEPHGGELWFSLAEIKLYKYKLEMFDPETGETTVL
ncbi:DUF4959 domain-containing protein [Bacteroides helcogenes]|uniref:DUF4959 domain-containing protein n=1 Tax=Bacteroides helcogenes (strain ATCC 35417 / DSM 20613 / JCM 6297 / CCUG 15421 / P 36-108) TaxID=693979 RepID=E6STU9_BACT6|nr:DUF4959 domain-containing protein [Bacteroides helcogenes]ADV42302.1 hypothetical protein Bache_0272 [Bacteroides helcogenes P 36-108]MDY5237242.1 DUF4959 domain-containing protein [Bacteroides helcogenes]